MYHYTSLYVHLFTLYALFLHQVEGFSSYEYTKIIQYSNITIDLMGLYQLWIYYSVNLYGSLQKIIKGLFLNKMNQDSWANLTRVIILTP